MTAAEQIANRFRVTHRLLLAAAEACTDDDLRWLPGPTAPPIAFHLWHCGRWADRWAESLGAGGQIWTAGALAAAWGFPGGLGGGETGMQMPDDEAAALHFPERSTLMAYLREAFAALEGELGGVDDARLQVATDDLLGEAPPLGESLLRQLAHANRHLGMIEALRGVRGGHGTVTV